jgi:hypothetical protein
MNSRLHGTFDECTRNYFKPTYLIQFVAAQVSLVIIELGVCSYPGNGCPISI